MKMSQQLTDLEINNMEQDKTEKVFLDGISFEYPSDKAPDFILLKGAISGQKLFRFCQEHQNERGFINFEVKRSKNTGKLYAELNTWKPNAETKQQTQEYNDNKYRVDPAKAQQNQKEASEVFPGELSEEELVSLDQIPF